MGRASMTGNEGLEGSSGKTFREKFEFLRIIAYKNPEGRVLKRVPGKIGSDQGDCREILKGF